MDDRSLRDNVLAELDFEPGVNAANIGVAVSDGIVTLSGRASSYDEKLRAEEAARRVQGVRAIAQEIRVDSASGSTDDADLALRVAKLLEWIGAASQGVQASVEKGGVILTGQVEHDYQRRIAEQQLRTLSGVSDITNEVTVRPSVAPGDIRRQIEAAFVRNAVDIEGVRLDVGDGEVRLTGTVRTLSARNAIERIAWSAVGVHSVDDELTVASPWDEEFSGEP